MKIVNLLPNHYIEHEYFNRMFRFFDPVLFVDKIIYVSHNYKELPSYGENVIAILTAGDERGIPPTYSNKIKFIFKHHLGADFVDNVYHIPLPYCGGFVGDDSIPINKRKYDVFFVGRHSRREDMISALNDLQKRRPELKYRIFITGHKFKQGWPIEKYSQEMMQSKIVLSPQGAVRAECIRFSEAVKCGCSIIACKHPNVKCFNECPAEYLHNWRDLERSVDILLNPEELEKRHEKMKECWDKYFSPEAVGLYINRIVQNGKCGL
jgi:hypothetical protein